MRTIVVYDDTGKKSEVIEDIIGEKGFSDVVVRKRRLEDYYHDELKKIYPGLIWKKICSVFEYADLNDEMSLIKVMREIKPDYLFHLAAQSYPQTSFTAPIDTLNTKAFTAVSNASYSARTAGSFSKKKSMAGSMGIPPSVLISPAL